MIARKKILMLGGAYSQIPAIEYAKKAGYYVITCDYLPGNPGHVYSAEYYSVSTTEKEEVLNLATKLKIDGVVAYASDPSAPTAAYVSDKLGLPGASYQSVKVLSEKNLFRDLQKKYGFNYPRYICTNQKAELDKLGSLKFPVFVKPVDSSGSKGVIKLESQIGAETAIETALKQSRSKKVIIEEQVLSPYKQLHGDGFVYNGELVFIALCDHHINATTTIMSSYPPEIDKQKINLIKGEISKILQVVGFKEGAINVEARMTGEGQVYIMEIGPRSGGNYIPQLMECATGFNEVAAVIDVAMGYKPKTGNALFDKHCFQYIIGAKRTGTFNSVKLTDTLKARNPLLYLHKKAGDTVNPYKDSSGVIGVIVVSCTDNKDLKSFIENIDDHVSVNVS